MAASGSGLPSRRALLLVAVAGAGSLRVRPARAASLDVNPMYLDFPPGRMAATLEITNRGDTVTAVQIRAFTWTQEGDEDKLDPTQDVIISPAAATVDAQESQLVRVLLRHPSADADRYYRVLVDELPRPGAAKTITVALRFSVPVFAPGTGTGHPDLHWQMESVQGHELVLVARNPGAKSIRINRLDATLQGGQKLPARAVGNNPFVLPGAERRWRLELPPGLSPTTPLHLTAQTSAGVREQVLTFMP